MLRLALRLVRRPMDDYMAALAALLPRWRWPYALLLFGSAALTWWVYVPLHELAHAYGCILGGGTFSQLDIAPEYGAALLQRLFPFVSVGSDYAGQLRGFEGSDIAYLLTDFMPFVATILLGVPLLHSAANPRLRPAVQAALFGVSLPIALAPFISLTGDYYEMGSILVSRAVAEIVPGFSATRWRSDDVFKLASQLFEDGGTGTTVDVMGVSASLVVGIVLAFSTYAAGVAWARVITPRGIAPTPVRARSDGAERAD